MRKVIKEYSELPNNNKITKFFNDEMNEESQKEVYCSVCRYITKFAELNFCDIDSINREDEIFSILIYLKGLYAFDSSELNSESLNDINNQLEKSFDEKKLNGDIPEAIPVLFDAVEILELIERDEDLKKKEIIEKNIRISYVHYLLKSTRLTVREAEAINKLYLEKSKDGEKKTTKQVAAEMGVSKSRVKKLNSNGLRKLYGNARCNDAICR